jgi:hypothetical protein
LSSAAAAQNSHPPSQPARFTTKNSTTQQKKDPHRPTLDIRVTRQDCAGECTEFLGLFQMLAQLQDLCLKSTIGATAATPAAAWPGRLFFCLSWSSSLLSAASCCSILHTDTHTHTHTHTHIVCVCVCIYIHTYMCIYIPCYSQWRVVAPSAPRVSLSLSLSLSLCVCSHRYTQIPARGQPSRTHIQHTQPHTHSL